MELTQQSLVSELAVAVSQFMQVALPHDTDKDGFVSHSFQGPFDENCYILAELGAARGFGISLEDWHNKPELRAAAGAFKFLPPDQKRV